MIHNAMFMMIPFSPGPRPALALHFVVEVVVIVVGYAIAYVIGFASIVVSAVSNSGWTKWSDHECTTFLRKPSR